MDTVDTKTNVVMSLVYGGIIVATIVACLISTRDEEEKVKTSSPTHTPAPEEESVVSVSRSVASRFAPRLYTIKHDNHLWVASNDTQSLIHHPDCSCWKWVEDNTVKVKGNRGKK